MFAPREKSRTARSIRTVLLAGTIAALLVVLGAAAWVSFDASEEEAQHSRDNWQKMLTGLKEVVERG